MTHVDIDKGTKGAKRASWAKMNYRDLALRICEDNPEGEVEALAKAFLAELERYPGYMQSIAIYIMANVKASLDPARQRKDVGKSAVAAEVIERAAAKVTAAVLMNLEMPNGKALRDSTGADCIKAGGWLGKVGRKVGPKGVVGEKITEEELQKLFKAS